MRRIAYPLLAVSSLLLAMTANAATRPRYGGTLRVQMRGATATLDPSTPNDALDRLCPLLYDTLLRVRESGDLQPWLATRWDVDPANKRFHLWIRRGVKFHDGAPLTPADVADSLLHANPNWRVRPVGDSVVIETPAVAPTLLFELAMPRNSIVRHTRNGRIEGTGPFLLQQWQPGKTASLSSSEEYWSGRPYLDSASITMGQSLRDQQLALQLGKADVVELSPDLAAHNAEAPGRARVVASSPTDLVAVVFAHNSETVSDIRVRAAIALALDRNSIQGVLLQKQGVPAASIMPGWMSGYDFLFVSSQDIGRARQLRAQARQNAPIILAYDPADALLKLIAERVALNARDAGLNVQAFAAANGDARVVRVKLPSTDPGAAIVSLVRALAGSDPQLASDVPEQWFTIDRDLMSQRWVVPVVYIPEVFGVAPTVRNWSETRDGSWRLEDVWVAQETP